MPIVAPRDVHAPGPPFLMSAGLGRTVSFGGVEGGALELAAEPGAGHTPITLDRRHGHVERVGDLGDRETDEEPECDDQALALAHGDQTFERLVEREDVETLLLEVGQDVVERHPLAPSIALGGVAFPRMVDECLPHRLRRGGVQVPAVRGVRQDVALEQFHHCLVHEGAGLKSVAGPLPAHQVAGHLPQLAVDGPDESVPGAWLPRTGRVEQCRLLTSCIVVHRGLPPRGEERPPLRVLR